MNNVEYHALKDDAAATVRRAEEVGLTPTMITGDSERTAQAIAARDPDRRVRAAAEETLQRFESGVSA